MSNSKTNTATVTPSKFTIVQKIQSFLKLGDSGKMDSFFTRVEKTLKRQIAAHEANIETIKFNSNTQLEALRDQHEDAKQSLEEAYMALTPEDVATNEKQVSFMDTYLENVAEKQLSITKIESKVKSVGEATDEKVKAINKSIDELNATIKSVIG